MAASLYINRILSIISALRTKNKDIIDRFHSEISFRPEEAACEENDTTWSLVWFDHEDFDWDNSYRSERDGLLHGRDAVPDLKTLFEIYFCGSLEAEYEEDNGVKPTREWYEE